MRRRATPIIGTEGRPLVVGSDWRVHSPRGMGGSFMDRRQTDVRVGDSGGALSHSDDELEEVCEWSEPCRTSFGFLDLTLIQARKFCIDAMVMLHISSTEKHKTSYDITTSMTHLH